MNRVTISRIGIALSLLIQVVAQANETSVPDASQRQSIRLFGKLEFRGKISTLPQWGRVLIENDKYQIFQDDFKINPQTTWGEFKQYILSQPDKKEQLKVVNTFWNRWPYRTDMDVYSQEDYWAIPDEFRRNSGDCEDYSIAKYFTLKELGFPPENLRLVVVRETIRNQPHAILVVYLDDDAWVLDNLNNALLSHTFYKHYDAQYSVNENFRWSYVKPKEEKKD